MPKKKKGTRRDTTTQARVGATPVTEFDIWVTGKEELMAPKLSKKKMKTWQKARDMAVNGRGVKDAKTLEDKKKVFIQKMKDQSQEMILTKTEDELSAPPEPQAAPKMSTNPLNMDQLAPVRNYFEKLGWARGALRGEHPGNDKARETEHLIWNSRYFKTFKESGVWEEEWQKQVKLREDENARRKAAGKEQASKLKTPPSELWVTRNVTEGRAADAETAKVEWKSDRHSYYLSVWLDILYNCFLNNLYGYTEYGDENRYKCWILNNPHDMTTLFGARDERKIGWRNYLKMMESFIIEDLEGNRICSISAFVYDILYNLVYIEQSLDRKLVMKDLPLPHSEEPSITLTNIPFNYLKMIINEARATGKVSVDKKTFTDAVIKMNDDVVNEADKALINARREKGDVATRLEMRSMSLTELVEYAGTWLQRHQVQNLQGRVDKELETHSEEKVLERMGSHIFRELLSRQPEEPHIIQMIIADQLVNIAVNSIEVAPISPVALEQFKSLTDAWMRANKVTTPIWGEWFDNEENIDKTTTELYSTLLDYLFPEVVKTKTPEEEEAERESEAAAGALVREEEEGRMKGERKTGKHRKETKKGRGRGRERAVQMEPEPDDEREDEEEDEEEEEREEEDEEEDEELREMIRRVYDKCSHIYGGDFKDTCGGEGKGIDFKDIADISIQIYHFLKNKTIKFIVGKLSVYFDLDDPRTFWIALIMFCLIYFTNTLDFSQDFMVKGGISLILNTHQETPSGDGKHEIPINDIDISIKPDKNERPVILFKLAVVILCSGELLLKQDNTFNQSTLNSGEIEKLREYIDLNYTEWEDSDGNYIKILQIGNKGIHEGHSWVPASYVCDLVVEEQPFKEAHLMSGGEDSEGNPLPGDDEWSSFTETFFGVKGRPISYFIYRSLAGNIDSYKKMAEDCLSLGLELIQESPDDKFIFRIKSIFSNKNSKLDKFRNRLFTFRRTLSKGDNVPTIILRIEGELFENYHHLLGEAVDRMIVEEAPDYDELTPLADAEAYIEYSEEKGYDIGLREGLNAVLSTKMSIARKRSKKGGGKLYKRSMSKRYKRKKTKKKKRKKTRKKTKKKIY